ncbi:uncharacterized protein YjgD (DUF1641 family) [Alicyclobacillus sacchari]|uniref:Uncharacterized protein YjgD (DUF1641 family) n=1 Tax=Alicyclobacillus sacchari TaxID=392010 RepID=A0A4R8LUG8_9BACL|nr:DUF1641 domain-containing protein [Alicyclobacillus sacchari]TDY51420.1 uncharacterized protein YjgD (DUF1641 family) [Alicyclobacillus sacchari]GMA56763.1 hypothetical protein GCM10025858_12660 [Alicyclobacillus sacchari]
MAQPIRAIERPTMSEEKNVEEALHQLQTEVARHGQALAAALTVLEDMQRSGLMDLAHGMLGAKQQIAEIVLEQVMKPGVLGAVQNAMAFMELAGGLDPHAVRTLTHALAAGVEEGQRRIASGRKVGFLTLARVLSQPDVNRAVAFLVGLLEGIGRELNTEGQ